VERGRFPEFVRRKQRKLRYLIQTLDPPRWLKSTGFM